MSLYVHHVAFFFQAMEQLFHYHFIRMPETACPSLLPLNYLPVGLKKSGSDPDRLSRESERERGERSTSKLLVSNYHGTNIA